MKKWRFLFQFCSLLLVSLIIYYISSFNSRQKDNRVYGAYPPPGGSITKIMGDLPYRVNLPMIINNPTPTTVEPPPSSLSYYISENSYQKLYNLGCNEGMFNRSDALVLLDFGSPWNDGTNYGTTLLWYGDTPRRATIADIEIMVKGYLTGYHSCRSATGSSHLTLGIGTSNNGAYIISEHGKQWAGLTLNVYNWIESPPSWKDHMTVVSAIDIELDWASPSITKQWVEAYNGVSGRKDYYNYGTCEGCPTKTDNIAPNNGWTKDDIWYV